MNSSRDISGHFDPVTCIDIGPFTLYKSKAVRLRSGDVAGMQSDGLLLLLL